MTNSGLEKVQGTSTVTVSNINSDAKQVVCQGVQVKQVSWGYDFGGVKPFYIFDSNTKELRDFGRDKIGFKGPLEKEKLKLLKQNLEQVVRGYMVAGQSGTEYAESFKGAAKKIDLITKELPKSTKLLQYYLDQIMDRRGEIVSENSVDSLVLRVIFSSANWRLPIF